MSKREHDDNRKREVNERGLVENRFEESRQFQTHDFERRVVMHMSWNDPLHFEPYEIPEGMEYKWVRESVLGVPDLNRSVETKRRQWTVVPAERHPDRIADDFFGRMGNMKGFIYYKGLVLCERPVEYSRAEMRERAKQNYKILADLPSLKTGLGDAEVPIVDHSQTFYGSRDVSYS
jgi:hypothetical protein